MIKKKILNENTIYRALSKQTNINWTLKDNNEFNGM